MDRFFAILSEGVHRFEGTVNQYTGDGIMALFGAPIAHEDHARRACYAALHLSEELRRCAEELKRTKGLNFSVRMGLNSGEVVVGKIGEDLRMDYTAQGQTVGLAARMEQLAEPGRAYVTEYTAKLVEGFFDVRDLGEFDLKGVGKPVRGYELQGVGRLRTRLDVSRTRGFSKFVGRADEMAALEAALERAIQGNGQVVGVVGEAGVGKSRLCCEFLERCRGRGVRVHEARGVAHGRVVPLLPVLEFLRDYFGITDCDSDETARDKIAGRTIRMSARLADVLPLLFDFLGVPDTAHPISQMDPESRQRRLYEVLRRLTRVRSESEPAVLLFEDLHWLDTASEGYLWNLVETVPGTRTLLLVNFRPEYQPAWAQESYYQQLSLVAVGREAIHELLRHLLGDNPSLGKLPEVLYRRSGGNPFFIEELVQSMVEGGSLKGSRGVYRLVGPIAERAIPVSVQSVLAARIDRLAEREKSVLHTAAVIGRTFSEAVLARIVDLPGTGLAAVLHALTDAEFVFQESLYPEAEYSFKHPLTQEVALNSQLQDRRRCTHAAVARAVESTYRGRLDEHASLLAHHWESAGEAMEAARWHRRAAEWALGRDPTSACRHWHATRRLLAGLEESDEIARLRLLACASWMSLGWRVGASADQVKCVFSEGLALAEGQRDARALALLHQGYSSSRLMKGDPRGAVGHSRESVRYADETSDLGLKMTVRASLVTILMALGNPVEALSIVEGVLAAPPEDPRLGIELRGYSPFVFHRFMCGFVLGYLGRLAESQRVIHEGVELARSLGEQEVLIWALSSSSLVPVIADRQALPQAERAVELAEEGQLPFSLALSCLALGKAYLSEKRWREAAGAIQHAMDVTQTRETAFHWKTEMLGALAETLVETGDGVAALARAREAVALSEQHGLRAALISNRIALVRALLRTERMAGKEEIEASLEQARTLIADSGAVAYAPAVHVEAANLARLDGNDTAYDREVREAHRLLSEMGATGHAERLAKELKKAQVSKRKAVAQKPEAKSKSKSAKPTRKTKPKRVRQAARRKSDK